jgi:hypothetical protein
MADMVGPWKTIDIRSLAELCEHVRRLDDPPQPGRGLLAPLPLRYTDRDKAITDLHRHPIYRWLKRQTPAALEAQANEFKLVAILLRCMSIGFSLGNEPPHKTLRADRRATIVKAIDRVEKALAAGTILMANQPKHEMLTQLLAEAKADLETPRSPGAPGNAVLEALASSLFNELGISDTKVIEAVAIALEISCDERLAQRYVAEAKATAPPRP